MADLNPDFFVANGDMIYTDGRYDDVIENLPAETEDSKVFHTGTQLMVGEVVTNGGRVLGITALGDSVVNAQSRAYDIAKGIGYHQGQYRTDIGYRAITRETF